MEEADEVQSDSDEPTDAAGHRVATHSGSGTWAAVLAVMAIGFLVLACFDTSGKDRGLITGKATLLQTPWTGLAVAALAGALVSATWVTVARRRSPKAWWTGYSWTGLAFVLAGIFLAIVVIYTWPPSAPLSKFSSVAEGRPRRRRLRGKRRHACGPVPVAVTEPSSPIRSSTATDLTHRERATLHRMWARAAGHEAESIASFLQLEADLAAVDAPQDLRDWALAAADDEVRHTTFASQLADEVVDGPTLDIPTTRLAFRTPRRRCTGPIRQQRLLRLAIESYIDGCCNEGSEVLRLRSAAQHASPELADALIVIAADEASHAELAWAIVEWTIAESGPAVVWALRHRPLPQINDPSSPDLPNERDERLQNWGWVSPTIRNQCIARARTGARARLETFATTTRRQRPPT